MDSSCIECDEENCFSGIQILELSKLHMYKFWYDILKKQPPEATSCPNIRLLMTDTNSFIFQIFTKDLDMELQKLSAKRCVNDLLAGVPPGLRVLGILAARSLALLPARW
jgi:hypothetical protein